MQESENKNSEPKDFAERIAAACDGLIYISETDAPVEPFSGGAAKAINSETISKAIAAGEAHIKQSEFDQFFERLTRQRDWHGATEKKAVRKFAALERLLKDNLRDLKVFRLGRVRIDIYVVGIDVNGNLAGIKTMAVET